MSVETLEQNDANALLIASSVVSIAFDDLRGHVLTGTNYRVGSSSISITISLIQDGFKFAAFGKIFLMSVE